MRVLDLFSGIGGFSLGLERAGMKTVAFCEIEPFCRRVLAKHWPGVPIYDDVRSLTADRLAADGISVDVICGGFPCQDISVAGAGAGLAGERSGLWRDYARLIGEIRPRFVIVENVAALLFRGLGDVLGDLATLGYDAEWHCIPAAAVGAPHRRDRLWIVGYPNHEGQPARAEHDEASELPRVATYSNGKRIRRQRHSPTSGAPSTDQSREEERQRVRPDAGAACGNTGLVNTDRQGMEGRQLPFGIIAEYAEFGRASWWQTEPDVGRVADGVPSRVDRIKGLGNAVVPQIPELIGRAIMRAAA